MAESDELNNVAVTAQTVTVAPPFVDLAALLVAPALPPAVVAGDGTNIDLSLDLFNAGNTAVNATIDIEVYASLDGDPLNPSNVLLSTQSAVPVNLSPGDPPQNVLLSTTMPAGLADGDYHLLVKADSGDVVAESDELNNVAVTAQTVTVAPPFVDLAGQLVGPTLPPFVVAGDGTNIDLPLDIVNAGNSPVNATIDIEVYASLDGDPLNPSNVLLSTQSAVPVNLSPGDPPQNVLLSTTMPAGIAGGDYHMIVKVDSADAVAEADELNNTLVTLSTVMVDPLNLDLEAELVDEPLPPAALSGSDTDVDLTVDLINHGNVAINQTIDIEVHASTDGDPANPGNVLLTTLNAVAVNLAPGTPMTQPITATFPSSLADGNYFVIVKADSADALAEADEVNNTVVSTVQVAVAPSFVDLVGQFSAPPNPPAVVDGVDTDVNVTVDVMSAGNAAAAGTIDIEFHASPDGDPSNPSNVLLHTVTGEVINLAPGQVHSVPATVTIPSSLAAGTWFMIAEVDSANAVVEADDANNAAVSPEPMPVTAAFIDLVGDLGDPLLPPFVVAGDGTNLDLTANIGNMGNTDAVGTIDITVHASPDGDPANPGNVLLATDTGVAINLTPGAFLGHPLSTTMPAGIPGGNYVLLVEIDSGDVLAESDELNNHLVTPQSVMVDPPAVDLTGQLGGPGLPPSVIAGEGENVDVSVDVVNDGNVDAVGNIDITVHLSPDGDPANPANVLLTTEAAIAVNLAPGAVMGVPITTTVPGGVAPGGYMLLVQIDSSDLIPESDELNNALLTPSILNVDAPFVDLTAQLSGPPLPPTVEAGDGTSIDLTVDIVNDGNVDAVGSIDVTVHASPDGDPANPANVLLTTQPGVALNLAPGGLQGVPILTSIPVGTPAGSYMVLVQIDTGDVIAESDELNNAVATVGTITVETPQAPSFIAGSDDLSTVPYHGGFVGRTESMTGQGVASGESRVGTFTGENLLGVDTLKVASAGVPALGEPAKAVWFARDDAGVVWIFKIEVGGVVSFEALDLTQLMEAGATPNPEEQLLKGIVSPIGTTFTDPEGNTTEVLDTAATLPQFGGETFVLIKLTDVSLNESFRYWHEATGLAAEFFGTNADPLTNDGFVTDVLQ